MFTIFLELTIEHFFNDKVSVASSATPILSSIMMLSVNIGTSELLAFLGIISAIGGLCLNSIRAVREIQTMRRESRLELERIEAERSKEEKQRNQLEINEQPTKN